MEDQNKVEKLLKHMEEYAETRFDIVVLNVQEKVSGILSSIASAIVVGIFSLFVLFFVSFGGAWYLGEYFHSPSIGFFFVAGINLVIALLIYFNREKWIKIPLVNALIRKINIHEED